MKKATYEAIYSALTAINYDNEEVMNELLKEINRGADLKAQKAREYDSAKEIVFKVLRVATEPMTIAQIYSACAKELSPNFPKERVQYGMTHQWANEIVKIATGKVNAYSLR